MAETKKPKKDLATASSMSRYGSGLAEAMRHLRASLGDRPLFVPPTRRYIPMRHRQLGELLSGPQHPGLPTGVFIEVKGQESSGKTSLMFALMEAVINQDPKTKHRIHAEDGIKDVVAPRKVLYLDFENVLDLAYLESAVLGAVVAQTDEQGLKVLNARDANVFIHQPDLMEVGIEIMLHCIASGEFGMVVIDSVPAMLPMSEAENPVTKSMPGELARAMSTMFRRSCAMARRLGVTVVLINQWRDKIGTSFGDPRTSPGGHASKYFDAVTLDVMGTHKTEWFEGGKCKTVVVKNLKNKIGGDRKDSVVYHLGDGMGLSAEVEATEAAVRAGIVELKRGRVVVRLQKERSFASRLEWLRFLRKNPKNVDLLWSAAQKRGVRAGVLPGLSNGFDDED